MGIIFRTKRPRNRRRKSRRPWTGMGRPAASLGGWIGLAVLSLFFIFCHDLLTQCRYFSINRIEVSGAVRLSENRIAELAGVAKGANLLAVNLATARKRLLAQPWIAEAAVRREIPDGIAIRVREHRPMAVVDLGRKFVVDQAGVLFMETGSDVPEKLPVVEGLRYADLQFDSDGRPALPLRSGSVAANAAAMNQPESPTVNSMLSAVMEVLQLGGSASSVLPNDHIRKILVDRELGLTLLGFDSPRSIRLGWGDLQDKYRLLASILFHLRQGRIGDVKGIESIDLKNINRIVLNPLRETSPGRTGLSRPAAMPSG
jgi:cell division protein FtsQ